MIYLFIGIAIGVGACVYLYVRRMYAQRVLERGKESMKHTIYNAADKIKDQAGRL